MRKARIEKKRIWEMFFITNGFKESTNELIENFIKLEKGKVGESIKEPSIFMNAAFTVELYIKLIYIIENISHDEDVIEYEKLHNINDILSKIKENTKEELLKNIKQMNDKYDKDFLKDKLHLYRDIFNDIRYIFEKPYEEIDPENYKNGKMEIYVCNLDIDFIRDILDSLSQYCRKLVKKNVNTFSDKKVIYTSSRTEIYTIN